MNAESIKQKLEKGIPLFDHHPKPVNKMIIGTDSEFGSVWEDEYFNNTLSNENLTPRLLPNGGELYLDCGYHLEYASPEASNPVSALAFYEAGKIHARKFPRLSACYSNNVDGYGNSYGSHESYLTITKSDDWDCLAPYLVARLPLCGSGYYSLNGQFEISERARHINEWIREGATNNRVKPMICNRVSDSSIGIDISKWNRLHIVSGDANMIQSSTLLRLGVTSMLVGLMDIGELPHIPYNIEMVGSDMLSVSKSTNKWHLRGVLGGENSALGILQIGLEKAKKVFAGTDETSDAVLYLWEDTINNLSIDPDRLYRRIDWVAKKRMIDLFESSDQSLDKNELNSRLASICLEYHNLDPGCSMYDYLLKSNQVERIVSDELIHRSCHIPPIDTRAYLRGMIAHYLSKYTKGVYLLHNLWGTIAVTSEIATSRADHPKKSLLLQRPIPDPYDSYVDLYPGIKRKLKRYRI